MQFKNIPSNKKTKTNLLESVKNNRLSHAHLLLGEDGSASLAIAWAFAQYLICVNRSEEDSCGKCSSCLKSSSLNHPDIHWVFPIVSSKGKPSNCDLFLADWRSFLLQNNYPSEKQWFSYLGEVNKQGFIGIGDANNITKKMLFKPYEASYQVIIIWHSEKMIASAANKLLKTLEEPPKNTVFLLLCSNKDALLDTIVSRLQRVRIPPPSIDVLASFLNERFSSNKDLAEKIAGISKRNIGKAIELLGENEKTTENIESFQRWARLCYQAKLLDLCEWVEEVKLWGREQQKGFLSYALHVIRECLVQRFEVDSIKKTNNEELLFIKNFSPFINQSNVIEIVKELELAHVHLARNGNSKIIFMDLSLKMIVLLHVKNINLHKTIQK